MNEDKHGTMNWYVNKKCRCDKCRAANSEYVRKRKAEVAETRDEEGRIPGKTHGKQTTYGAGCRCIECREAHSIYYRMYRGITTENIPAPGYSCWCCGAKPTTKLVLDHDHITGEFRGWLCVSCNTGIGKLGDSIEGLERALEYLRKHYI